MKKLLAIISLVLSPIALSCNQDGTGGFMPENDMYISADAKMRNDMTEERFNEIIDKVTKHYKPIINKKLKMFKVNKYWTNGTVNASAMQLGPLWIINMYGGLARHESVTDDAFALVVCHELGHHLGGAPKNSMIGGRWASNEGQADYFGAMKCFRRVFQDEDNARIMADVEIPTTVKMKCENSFANEGEIALCMRTAMAGQSLSVLLNRGAQTSFDTPDKNVVDKTYDRHPAGQCRLDTYFQGALCDRGIDENVSNKDPNKGVCSRRSRYSDGIRPLCWYKPKA